jgi:hypothetical protein
MKYRKLRVAWSVGWGILCVLLIVLWVRSYWRMDSAWLHFSNPNALRFNSTAGQLRMEAYHNEGSWAYEPKLLDSTPIDYSHVPLPKFGIELNSAYVVLLLPHWLKGLICLALAAVPWLNWRFSLRTLLIVMTLVAVGLGAIVYAVR